MKTTGNTQNKFDALKTCLDYNIELKMNFEKSQKKIESLINTYTRKLEKEGQDIKNYLMFK